MGNRYTLIATLLAATTAGADDAPPVSVPDHVVGDGRTVVPVTVSIELPPSKEKVLPVPEVATVTCSGASSLPASASAPPSVLAPVVTKPTTLDCVARLRSVESKFRVSVRPPGPGLYATPAATDLRSTAHEVALDVVAWSGSAAGAPSARLRAAASDGKLAVKGGKLVLELGGNAPRLVAIVLADGDQLGAAFVPVTGVTTVPIESEPGATVQAWIAGRWFGPVKTKGKLAQVPIEVPAGITHGVARSTGRAGYVTDAITDLKVPARPRIAAVVTNPDIHVGEPATIAVAIAGTDGRPGAPTLAIRASAGRGKLGAAKSLGVGLWSVPYTAPLTAGSDRVTIAIDGDPRAGTAEVPLDVAAGGASRIAVDVPPGPYEPGAEIAGTVRVFDASNNPVRDAAVTATLGGATLAITHGDPIAFRGRVPEHLPAGELAVEVTAGRVTQRVPVQAGGAAVSASLHATVDGRHAIAEVVVRDRFGNLVPESAFELQVTGAVLQRLERKRNAFQLAVRADGGATSARFVIRAGGRVIADDRVRFEPPAEAYVLGAWASGGWVDNLGVLAGPRAGAGLVVRRGLAGIEVAALLGVEGMRFRDTTQVTIDTMPRDADRAIDSLGVLASVRARLRLSRRLGLALGAGIVPMRVRIGLDTGAQSADDYAETVLGVRAQLHGDLVVGPGRAFVGGSYGRARLSDGAVVGQLEGLAVVAGYEWWFADFGW